MLETVEETIKHIEDHERERILMNVNQFDQLLKRVNFEDSTEVKHQMLSVIEGYLKSLAGGSAAAQETQVKVEELKLENTTPSAEPAVEAVAEEKPLVEQIPPIEEVSVEATEEPVQPEEPKAEALISESTLAVDESGQGAFDLGEVETVKDVSAEKPVEGVREDTPAEIAEIPSPGDEKVYVENFGLPSTTKEEQLEVLKEKGGVIFRDKRSYMLSLSLDDEILALAKTQKIEEFPSDIRAHLKAGKFVTVDVLEIGKVEVKGRSRNVDVMFKNFQKLSDDSWIAKNILNLLEKGEVPEHAKEKEVAPVQEAQTEEAPNLVTTFMINPNLVVQFKDHKEAIKQQRFAVVSQDGTAKLFTQNGSGQTITVGLNEKATFKDGTFYVTIADYELKEAEGKTFAEIKLLMADGTEASQPQTEEAKETPAEPAKEEKHEALAGKKTDNVIVTPQGDVPSDFPQTNKLSLELHPYAEAMFSLEAAKAMVGKPINLGILTRPEEKESRISLMHDVFEMATTKNVLTAGSMRNSKWVARLTNIDLIEDAQSKRKSLAIEFDYLVEYPQFTFEPKEDVRDVLEFVPITEQSYTQRQLQIGQSQEASSAGTAAQPSPSGNQGTVTKEYDTAAGTLLEPTGNASGAYQELTVDPNKNGAGAMQEISSRSVMTAENSQGVMEKANQAISTIINKTFTETGIHAVTETKQAATTEVVGNLKDGAGELTETSTVIQFMTGYAPNSWAQSIGKRIELQSELSFGNGPVTHKTVSMMGKNGAPVAQGQVPMNEALLMDGKHHSAVIQGIEGAQQNGNVFIVSMRLGDFTKVA
ncbi:hypothetical protein [Cytobacillus oceanisediminis]|uniref:hypothetical protein n=1 Tax=Cytobacillus oceanisediminis TaxID=665099 RepID=UPI001FB4D131|nr:hypothetical protein [Cytobacillus oceanisediminis]UOE58163.1 hypothetical protein IRB79_27030 [Cytobacillus oceanisediminis]